MHNSCSPSHIQHTMSSATPSYRSRALEEEMDKFRSMIQKFASPVPTDYIHTLAPDFVQYAASVRAASGNDAGKSRPRLSLVDVARSMATTQAFGRPMEGFSEDQVRRAFSLGDWEGGSCSPSLRNTAKVPEPIYREIRPIHIRDGGVLSTDQGKRTEEKAAGKKTVEAAPAVPKLVAVQGSVPPTAKRLKLKAGFLKPADSSTALPKAPSPAESAPVLAPPASQPPVPAPSPLVLPPVPKVDVSKLTGQRRVSDLTQPEVLTVRGGLAGDGGRIRRGPSASFPHRLVEMLTSPDA